MDPFNERIKLLATALNNLGVAGSQAGLLTGRGVPLCQIEPAGPGMAKNRPDQRQLGNMRDDAGPAAARGARLGGLDSLVTAAQERQGGGADVGTATDHRVVAAGEQRPCRC